MKLLVNVAVVAGGLLAAAPAWAEVALGAHVEGAIPIDSPAFEPGVGVGGYLGYRINLGPVHLMPEIAGDVNFLDARIIRARAGARFGFGKLVAPFVFAHLGYGHTTFEIGPTTGLAGEVVPAFTVVRDGLALDAGLGLDIRPIKYVSFGPHAGYNVTYAGMGTPDADEVGNPVAKWVSLGIHATLLF